MMLGLHLPDEWTSSLIQLDGGRSFAALGEGSQVFDRQLSVFLKPENIHIGSHVRIDGLVKLEGGERLTIGDYVHIASFCHINGGGGLVWLDAHCGLASGVKVLGGQPDLRYTAICPQEPEGTHGVLRFTTVVRSYALLATNAVILPGVVVGEGAVIGAGSVVTHNVPAWEIWAGNPARKIGERCVEHGI